MIKLIRSMLYRATHDIFFYIAIGACIIFSLLIISFMGSKLKNHVTSKYDENVTVEFEKEDALNVEKHYYASDTYVHNIPGKDILYRDSLNNLYTVNTITAFEGIVLLIIHVLYDVIFFGEMYSKGAIRNMIAAGADKRKVFLSSLAVNAILLFVFSFIGILAMAVYALANGLYPIIYLPSFVVLFLAQFMVGTVISSLAVLVVFLVQRPLRSLLVMIVLVVVYGMVGNTMVYNAAFDMKYELNSTSYRAFFSKVEDSDVGFEFYFPVNGFNLYAVRKADGSLYSDFMTDTPNPDYSGDAKVTLARILWRTNIGMIPMEVIAWGEYPLYRDGVLYRYIAVSAVYMIIMSVAGCVAVKRRNII